MRPRLTIGMATYDDFKGVKWTVQNLRINHADTLRDCELLIVDNNPGSKEGEATRIFTDKLTDDSVSAGVRYVAHPFPVGTTAPREAVFREAHGDAVMCIDPHVMPSAGTIRRLLDHYDQHPEAVDLFCGPLLTDRLVECETHFTDVWRAQMWGGWARAWLCSCHSTDSPGKPLIFETAGDLKGQVYYRAVAAGSPVVVDCPRCDQTLPAMAYSGSFQELVKLGYKPLGLDPYDEPFEVPAQGLGLFSCRKAAWLGFTPHARGFGGEEMCLHIKYRQAGRKTICLPWLTWWHDFR